MANPNQDWKCIAELRGHDNWIYGVIFAPGNQLLSISGSEILLWDIETGKVKFRFQGHTDSVTSISLDADQGILASGSLDKTVKLWDVRTGELNCELVKRKDPIHSVTFSLNGKLLACGGENKYKTDNGKKASIYLWDVDRQDLIDILSGHDLRVNALAFSSDSEALASGSNDSTVRLWKLNSDEQPITFKDHSSNIGSVAFTSDGKKLISSGGGGIRIWDCETEKISYRLAEGSDYIRCFAIDPSESILAFEVHDSIEIYDFKTLRKLSRISFKWPTSINFSPNGKYLASGDATAFDDAGGLVRVWSVPEPQKTLPKTINVEDLEKEAQILSSNGEFNPKDIKDARARIIRSVVQRQGQPEFRSKLLKAYEGRCPVTDCDQVSAIEAAHIVPYKGTETNNPTNGLPLRADIHTLFDLHLFSINPDTYSLEIASALYGTCYHDLANRKLALPKDPKFLPSREALGEHYSVFLNRRAD